MHGSERTTLKALLGDYSNTLPLKRGEVASDRVAFDFADVKVPNTAFKRLVRDHEFDAGELAIVTFLQARAHGKPYVLLPAPVIARTQHHTLAHVPSRGPLAPQDLAGRRVGVRAYSVTTGVWVRGILARQFGLDLDRVQWVTFEDPHVAEASDPPAVTRAPDGKTMVQMLLAGELDAAVVGDKMPDPALAPLIPDAAAAQEWTARNGLPINHMLVVREALSRTRPDIVREVFRMAKESRDRAAAAGDQTAAQIRFGLEPNRRSLETIVDICFEQKLIPDRPRVEDLFDDTTRDLA